MTGAPSVIALAAALLLAGALFDSPSLYVPGVALALLAGGAAWVALAARGVRVERSRSPSRVVEGESHPLRFRIRSGFLPARAELVDPMLEHPLPIPARLPGRVTEVDLERRFPRRGRRRLEPARLVIRDPLGLHTCEARSEHEEEVLVLPRVERLLDRQGHPGAEASRGPFGGSEGGGRGGRATNGFDPEIDGLRSYSEGSPASRIHWPAVARTGELLERRLVAAGESTPLVVLDGASPESEEAFDAAVRAAASVSHHLAQRGGCALLLPGEERPLRIDPRLRGWPKAHSRLAVVEPVDRPRHLALAPHCDAVIWVSAASRPPSPPAVGRASRSISCLITPVPLPGLRTTFTVAGCHGQPLGRSRSAAGRARAAREEASS